MTVLLWMFYVRGVRPERQEPAQGRAAGRGAGSISPRGDGPRTPKPPAADNPQLTRHPLHSPRRAIAYSKGTQPLCRLPLITLSLFARGCSPQRPDAVIGTDRARHHCLSRHAFQGKSSVSGTPPKVGRSSDRGRRDITSRRNAIPYTTSRGMC